MTKQNLRPTVVLFTSVRRHPSIFNLILRNIQSISTKQLNLKYWFYDDNDMPETSEMLHSFVSANTTTSYLFPKLETPKIVFNQTENNHEWNASLVDRITRIKNMAIMAFKESDAQALFLFDSDIIFNPNTIEYIFSLNFNIVSEIFWTQFTLNSPFLPNVWDYQTYKHETPESILRLRMPGIYKVGGLGGCVMLRKRPLDNGLDYTRIPNEQYWGEDRHFSVRAVCLGYQLIVDSHYPAYHVYRLSQVQDCTTWMNAGYDPNYFSNWLDPNWEKAIRERFIDKKYSITERIKKAIKILINVNSG
jgi:hypothetical protein